MIERWKAEHPDMLSGGGPSTKRAPRPRLAVAPDPSPVAPAAEQRDMIERWRREHPELVGLSRPVPPPARPVPSERRESDRAVLDISTTPLTVLSAFVIGCILGGIAMTIITGIAFWGFSGG